jgi:hypothetical protein
LRAVKAFHAAEMTKIVTLAQEFCDRSLHAERWRWRGMPQSPNRRANSGGTTKKPSRNAGVIVLLKLPICSTRPCRSHAKRELLVHEALVRHADVPRETPSCAARSRQDGNFAPGANHPLSMASRIAP